MSPHREAWQLSWPLILSNLSVPLLGSVDTAVVGHLPEPHYLGAVAIGALLPSVLYFVFGFLRMGTTGLTAQAFGRGDGVALRAGLGRALLLALVIAGALLASSPAIVAATFSNFDPTRGSPRARELSRGPPARRRRRRYANLVLLGWLLGLQNARGPMALLITTNGVNIGLDLLFVLGFGWGVAGVAAATVCAEYGGLRARPLARRTPPAGAARRLALERDSARAAPSCAFSRSIATSCCAA